VNLTLGLRLRPLFDVAIPGLYAWVVTVLVPIHQKDAHGWSVFCSWLAAASLCTASGLVTSRLRAWSAVAVAVFVMSSASVWFLLAPFEASLGFLGSLGWASFAIGWVRAAETGDLTNGTAAHRLDLLPRHSMPKLSWIALAVSLAGALAALGLAWNIEGRERSLLGQAVAVIGALSLMTAAAASVFGVGRQAAARSFSRGQLGRTLVLVALFVFGCWLTFLRT
jgi:hypothetical protein